MPTRKTAAAPAKKTAAKTAPMAAPAKQAANAKLPAAAAAAAEPAKKPPKVRPKLVRDGFTMPESDFALIGTLKARALAGRREAKKSELLRAGLHALAALDRAALVTALDQLEPLKVGRPKKGH